MCAVHVGGCLWAYKRMTRDALETLGLCACVCVGEVRGSKTDIIIVDLAIRMGGRTQTNQRS